MDVMDLNHAELLVSQQDLIKNGAGRVQKIFDSSIYFIDCEVEGIS